MHMKRIALYFQLLYLLPFSFLHAQYCIPISQGQFLEPIVDGVTLGAINNLNNGFPQMEIAYSDYTSMSTDLDAGATYTLTIKSGAYFQYNYASWIDFNHNDQFESGEKIGSTFSAFNYPTVNIQFTVPANVHNGTTRLRVRATAEPYGVWNQSTDPCAPWQYGETEDYSVAISGGLENDLSASNIINPVSGVNLGDESISVNIQNLGTLAASDFNLSYSINNGPAVTETFGSSIDPDSSSVFTFSSAADFTGISCYDLKVWLTWINDEASADDTLITSICHTEPVYGSNVWYVQSDINGGLEPLGGPPYNSTTNRTCMNDVFGDNGWLEGSFEETNVDSVFNTASCLIFIDGSYEGEVQFQNYIEANRTRIENWVASGGHLLLLNANDGSLSGVDHIFNLGFDDTRVVASFSVGYAKPYETGHPIFSGPYTPAINEWSAFYYAISVLYGTNFDTLIADNDDEHFLFQTLNLPLLAEKKWGTGKVIFGTISPSQLVTPSSSAMNNRRNTLQYLNDCITTGDDSAIPKTRESMIVFPNPAIDEVTVQFAPVAGSAIICIRDLKGKEMPMVYHLQTGASKFSFDVSKLASGIYMLEMKCAERGAFQKLVVIH